MLGFFLAIRYLPFLYALCSIANNCCAQSLGRVTSSPVYNDATKEVRLTYTDGTVCGSGRKWQSIIAFTCDESQLQVCFTKILFLLLITVTC